MRRLVPVVMVPLVVALGGCAGAVEDTRTADRDGTAPPTSLAPSPGPARPTVDTTAMRSGSASYHVFTPEEFADLQRVVVTGRVDGWAAGPSLLSGGDERDEFAVLQVAVDDVFKGGKKVHDRHVYVVVERGGEVVKPDGTSARPAGAPSTITPMEDLKKAVPLGTRVLVLAGHDLGVNLMPDDPSYVTLNEDAGHPAGADLLQFGMQGLLLEQSDGSVTSPSGEEHYWGWFPEQLPSEQEFDWLVGQIADHFAS